MRRNQSWTTVLLAGWIALGGCRQDKPLRRLTIGIQNNTFSALVLVAQGKGFFEREGLAVTVAPYPSGTLALQGMLEGQVDLCTCADLPVMVEAFTRDDFRILCSVGHTGNGAWIVARRDRGITQPSDLKDKRIGTQRASAVHFFLSQFLLYHRIAASDVEIVYMPPGALPGALVDGTIDAFSMRNPFIAQAKAQLGERAIEFFEPHAYQQFFLLAMRRDILEADPSLARDAVAALVRAEAFAGENPAAARRIAAAALGQDRAAEVEQDWSLYTLEISLSQAMLRGMEDQAQWAMENGVVEGHATPEFRNLICGEAMRKVRPASYSLID